MREGGKSCLFHFIIAYQQAVNETQSPEFAWWCRGDYAAMKKSAKPFLRGALRQPNPQRLPILVMEATEPTRSVLWEGEQKWAHFTDRSSRHDLRAQVGRQFPGVSSALLSLPSEIPWATPMYKTYGCTKTLQMFLYIHTTHIYQMLTSDQALF